MQKCIIETVPYKFYSQCATLLTDGWKIIPGTVSTSITSAAANGAGFSSPQTEYVLVAFFEK